MSSYETLETNYKDHITIHKRSLSRVVSKDTSKPNSSCRVYYGEKSAGAIPFVWESQPGTPKHPLFADDNKNNNNNHNVFIIPPLTPPPSFSAGAGAGARRRSVGSIFLPARSRRNVINVMRGSRSSSSFSLSYSSNSSSSSSWSKADQFSDHSHDGDGDSGEIPGTSPTSTLCFPAVAAKKKAWKKLVAGCYAAN